MCFASTNLADLTVANVGWGAQFHFTQWDIISLEPEVHGCNLKLTLYIELGVNQ